LTREWVGNKSPCKKNYHVVGGANKTKYVLETPIEDRGHSYSMINIHNAKFQDLWIRWKITGAIILPPPRSCEEAEPGELQIDCVISSNSDEEFVDGHDVGIFTRAECLPCDPARLKIYIYKILRLQDPGTSMLLFSNVWARISFEVGGDLEIVLHDTCSESLGIFSFN